MGPPLAFARHPPQHPPLPLLVGPKVRRRRPKWFWAVLELWGSHPDVPLLPSGGLRPLPEAVPLVEEVPHHHPARAVRPGLLPRTPTAHIYVRLPSGRILDVCRHRGPVLHPQDSTWSGSSVKVAGPKYSDYRDTVLSLVADVSRLKFHGVIPGAPVGINRNLEQQPLINKQCSEQMKNQSKTEKVLVTPL